MNTISMFKKWQQLAQNELDWAKFAIERKDWNKVAYFCQQAVEKLAKAIHFLLIKKHLQKHIKSTIL